MAGIEFAITFLVGIGVFVIAVLPEPELQHRKRLLAVAGSFAGLGLFGYFSDEVVFSALGAATIPAFTLYYRTKDQRARIEKLEARNEELTEAVRAAEERGNDLRTTIDHLQDDKTSLTDQNATYIQAVMDITRNDLVNSIESLWELYRLEVAKAVNAPQNETKGHLSKQVVIFSLIKMALMAYCKTADEVACILDALNMSNQMKKRIVDQFRKVQGDFRD